MKQDPLKSTNNPIPNYCAISKKYSRISSSGKGKVKRRRMVQPEMVTVATSSVLIPEEPLCDDILSCISALDEVIAEFDDSTSLSSSSSTSSPTSGPGIHSPQFITRTDDSNPHSSSSSGTQLGSLVGTMEPNTGNLGQMEPCQKSSQFLSSVDPRHRSSAPVKPVRLSKRLLNGNTSSSPTFENPGGNSPNGNYLNYELLFPKSSNSASHIILDNNNLSPSPPKSIPNATSMESSGGSSSFPLIKSNKPVRVSSKSSTSSPQKPIPVTFVMKPEDLGRFLENETEEDWNCHIEKNLPRSLRKTRKTCFVEDDEEEQQNYCRSPKDFRRNLIITSDPRRSPLLNQRRVPESNLIPIHGGPRLNIQISPTAHHVDNRSQNNKSGTGARSRNLNEDFHEEVSPPLTGDHVLDSDDGYLSMVNRHDAPILWPEGAIESETFTPQELKLLSVSKMNHLNMGRGKIGGSELRGDDKGDYFSDDSLEFEGDGPEYGHQTHLVQQPDKMSSFIFTSNSPHVVQPSINKSSARKSWSPASEIRIPPKSLINSNTWRKGTIPSENLNFDENQEDQLILEKKFPLRKPCAFFIPLKSETGKETKSKSNQRNELGRGVREVHGGNCRSEVDKVATQITVNALESGIREAACINSLLVSPSLQEEIVKRSPFPDPSEQLVSVDLHSVPSGEETSLDSSLGLSNEDQLSSSAEEKESSSGMENETFTETHERNHSPLAEQGNSLPKTQTERVPRTQPCPLDDIEDLYENPPAFIPPPPQVQILDQVIRQEVGVPGIPSSLMVSLGRNSGGSDSDKDSFPQNLPLRITSGGDPVLRTQRQTSRSHENLLDIERIPHPNVRRGHSATLPSNTFPPPLGGRRPSALQQFFGMFRRNKKHSNSSVLDLPSQGSPSSGKKGFRSSVEDDSPQLPEHFSPFRSNRPSISESRGSQRSNTSQASRKRSVLSRIFRRKDK